MNELELEDEMFLTGFGYTIFTDLKPNYDFYND